MTKLFPEIKQLEPISISGRYNSVNDTIVLNATVPKLIYGANTISNGVIKINTVDNALVYSTTVGEIKNAQFRLPNTLIEGNVKDNLLTYKLQLRDTKAKDQYVVAGTLKAINGETELHLLPQDLLLNYEQWTLSEDNLIRFGSKGIYANNFVLKNGNSAIKMQSQFEGANAPLVINFTDFSIETISRMVQQESLAFGGLINGDVMLENLAVQPVLTSDLTIKDFSYKKETVGDISLKMNNKVANTYAVQATLTGHGNDVTVDGTYLHTNKNFDLTLDLKQLNLVSIQPFTVDQITKSSGHVSGNFHINGTAEQPKVIGVLQFHNGAFTVTKLNSSFELLNDAISFTEEGLQFKTSVFPIPRKIRWSFVEKRILQITAILLLT